MLLPNEFGLFDVLGNAYEWCHDGQRANGKAVYPPYPEGSIAHPADDDDDRRPTLDDTTWRMMRGGAYCYAPSSSRSASRYTVYVTLESPLHWISGREDALDARSLTRWLVFAVVHPLTGAVHYQELTWPGSIVDFARDILLVDDSSDGSVVASGK